MFAPHRRSFSLVITLLTLALSTGCGKESTTNPGNGSGPGNDRLVGGPGHDTCVGGPGRDRERRCER